ncbi:hypothetical protein [Mesorhizobium sp. M8A.F.Ca.ET.057.01.1.1]
MTVLLTSAPSYCSRAGVALLLVAIADFLFYGQPPASRFSCSPS